jgi:hypothetical protein
LRLIAAHCGLSRLIAAHCAHCVAESRVIAASLRVGSGRMRPSASGRKTLGFISLRVPISIGRRKARAAHGRCRRARRRRSRALPALSPTTVLFSERAALFLRKPCSFSEEAVLVLRKGRARRAPSAPSPTKQRRRKSAVRSSAVRSCSVATASAVTLPGQGENFTLGVEAVWAKPPPAARRHGLPAWHEPVGPLPPEVRGFGRSHRDSGALTETQALSQRHSGLASGCETCRERGAVERRSYKDSSALTESAEREAGERRSHKETLGSECTLMSGGVRYEQSTRVLESRGAQTLSRSHCSVRVQRHCSIRVMLQTL